MGAISYRFYIRFFMGRRGRLLGVLALGLMVGLAQAADVEDLTQEGDRWLQSQAESQKRVDALSEEERALAQEYRAVLRENEGLRAYNRQLQRQLDLQEQELATLDASFAQATQVDRQILPLMLRMVSALERFIELDLPFLMEEREQRLDFVRDALDRVDVTVAEQFRQVLEAYQVELEFGRTIEAYTDITTLDGQKLEVDFLRLGRIGLYYQTLDGSRSGRWDAATEQWQPLGAAHRNALREAIRVARKLTAPGLLTLPLPAPVPAASTSR